MKTTLTALIALTAALAGGCDRMNYMMPRQASAPMAATPAAAPTDTSARYAPPRPAPQPAPIIVSQAPEPTDASNQSAVEKALAWAQKYSEVSSKLTAVERENRSLAEKTQAMQQQLDVTKGQLAAAQKELGEANVMLKDLETRLAKWQENVLGYRQEMREAQKAQMDGLARVIKLLGGEAPPAAAGSATGSPGAAAGGHPANKENGHGIP